MIARIPRDKRKTQEYWMALSRTITGALAVALQCVTIYLILRRM